MIKRITEKTPLEDSVALYFKLCGSLCKIIENEFDNYFHFKLTLLHFFIIHVVAAFEARGIVWARFYTHLASF